MISEQELFDWLVDIETHKLTLADDIKQLKSDAAYDEDSNPSGIAKDEIKLIAAAAKLHAKMDYEEKKEAAVAVFKKYEELSGYNV